ncbi:symporter small accessory protein [Maridesulfovibrio ferrireducens]|uniref:symporter small accessory protein n=1 Tax=Maridesulfovibrio ferrireducens TaxID=246191 RepID=UPI001A34A97A|nr:symporter small accessory protein [Maridesulfovibrio ferrireducens]MBI9111559.1 hypothetical protein [Maridesulfovibrio ferrireducens]
MLGLGSIEIVLVFWLCLLAALGCVAYGIINWNKKGKPDATAKVIDIKVEDK